jgi:oligopeptide transport system ATP-binding protein
MTTEMIENDSPSDGVHEREVVVRIKNLTRHFPVRSAFLRRQIGVVKAVDDVTFDIYKGETLGLVGESGSGKTTTGRVILQLDDATGGSIEILGQDVLALSASKLRALRPEMQTIFQDPHASLNPRMTVASIIGEPLREQRSIRADEREVMINELLLMVGLAPQHANRYPHEFSGGQRQRIGIARAIALNPEFIVCDEPIAALDVSIQAQVVNLLSDLQKQLGLTYLFISHDLSMVRHISDRVAVMYLGKIVELADVDDLYDRPMHPYTQALQSAVPVPDPLLERSRERVILEGDIPSPSNPPSGCRFRTRCPIAQDRCKSEEPEFRELRPGHFVACHFADPDSSMNAGGHPHLVETNNVGLADA